MTVEWTRELGKAGVVRLAELLALKLHLGDVVTLSGELGAGKTTLARALISALADDDRIDVPSPTFSLQQTYVGPRLSIVHFDFYRLATPDEARELGFEEAADTGVVIVEWPERARELLPESRIEIELAEGNDPELRRVTVRGTGSAQERVRRVGELMAFLDSRPNVSDARIRHLHGDASHRSYARLSTQSGTVVLMDAPSQPDGPPVRNGKPYSQVAHLAEDMRPFVAIGAALRQGGLSAPNVIALDLDRGILLVEDLGNRLFAAELARGTSQHLMWQTAVDALIWLRSIPVPKRLPLPDDSHYVLPRRDRAAFEIEIELLLDWYWPAVKGTPAPSHVRDEFRALWRPVLDHLLLLPGGWFLRDYHSPNLIWLPERRGIARIGVLDFQDALFEHFAFDLVSLLQDARVDVPAALEQELFERYCSQVGATDPGFDRGQFAAAYAAFGAQRNTRLIGLWVRLLRRDGKPQYLAHLPRTWEYLDRNLAQPELSSLAAWYNRHFPPDARAGTLLS